ncbi:Uncharacterised protein [Escherichia coli]|nr:Uncharacterised protein [Escherichia coli]
MCFLQAAGSQQLQLIPKNQGNLLWQVHLQQCLLWYDHVQAKRV